MDSGLRGFLTGILTNAYEIAAAGHKRWKVSVVGLGRHAGWGKARTANLVQSSVPEFPFLRQFREIARVMTEE